jgi:hypothetical protein
VGGFDTVAAFWRVGRHFVIRDYLRASLYDDPVSASSLTAPTSVELPFELQGEAVTFAPGDRALLVAGERENALWWVPLTVGSASPTPTWSTSEPASPEVSSPEPSVRSSPGASASADASPSAGAAGSGGPVAVVLAVLAIGGAVGVAVLAGRRMRH